jgi:hypothetical protein
VLSVRERNTNCGDAATSSEQNVMTLSQHHSLFLAHRQAPNRKGLPAGLGAVIDSGGGTSICDRNVNIKTGDVTIQERRA